MITPDVIILFDGNHADIPSGYTRQTSFDDRFLKGASSGFGDTSGSDTHTHTSSSHTHNVSAHTHTLTTSYYTGTGDTTGSGSGNWWYHRHTATSGGLAATYTSSGSSPNWSSASNNPPNYRFIAIKANSYTTVPVNGCVLSQTDLTGFSAHTDSSEKLIAIADTSADAGSGTGSTTHAHTFSHSHGNISHNHSSSTSSTGSGSQVASLSSGIENHASTNHNHVVNYTANNAVSTTYSTSSDYSGIEPLSKGVKVLINDSGSSLMPVVGSIAMTLESTTPVGWKDCDGTNDTPNLEDFYVKNTTVNAENGANTHTHSKAHVHPYGNHTHAFSTVTNTQYGSHGTGSGSDRWSIWHNHGTGTTNSQGAANTTSGTSSAASSNNEPLYIKVKFIQFSFAIGGGSFLLNLI